MCYNFTLGSLHKQTFSAIMLVFKASAQVYVATNRTIDFFSDHHQVRYLEYRIVAS